MKVINDNDIEEFSEIKKCRNELAHEIVNFITKGPTINPLPLFPKMINLLREKIGTHPIFLNREGVSSQ